ncbi:hypothetical protein I4F81_012643 [Pyropia yezoensis]|uniref:Uncharacterized protein n=1 Tax=Pyropia yezoensis TaxID=2788 RepID=A0ACC3CIS3_PYRYE|nr:hypothetical protein I4F81_012643 [Neopyropia yezoensis]
MHQTVVWDKTSTVDRVAHYARLLGPGWALTQLHCATQMDQGDAPIDLAGAPPAVFAALAAVDAALRAAEVPNVPPLVAGQSAVLPSRARDAVQAALSAVNGVDTRLKSALRVLLAAAAAGDPAVPVAPVPFTAGSLEGHNFATLVCPYVAVLAASHRLVGWWAVYDAARAGRLVPPADVDALTMAAAVVSGADAFLFMPGATWASVGIRAVPTRAQALALLRSRVGGLWAAGLDKVFPAP